MPAGLSLPLLTDTHIQLKVELCEQEWQMCQKVAIKYCLSLLQSQTSIPVLPQPVTRHYSELL
jgi:hypothetical protein